VGPQRRTPCCHGRERGTPTRIRHRRHGNPPRNRVERPTEDDQQFYGCKLTRARTSDLVSTGFGQRPLIVIYLSFAFAACYRIFVALCHYHADFSLQIDLEQSRWHLPSVRSVTLSRAVAGHRMLFVHVFVASYPWRSHSLITKLHLEVCFFWPCGGWPAYVRLIVLPEPQPFQRGNPSSLPMPVALPNL